MAIGRRRSQRRKEVRALLTRLLSLLVLVLLSFASLYAYNFITTTDKLVIRNVKIEGLSRVDEGTVRPVLDRLRGKNIFAAQLGDLRRKLEGLPRIKEAHVKIVLPSTVVCRIREREPVVLAFVGRFVELDEEGMVMGADELTPKLDLPIITSASAKKLEVGKVCNDPSLQAALEALRICKRFGGDFSDTISEIRIGEKGVSIVSLEDDCIVLLGEEDVEGKLRKFFVLRDTINRDRAGARYIDLRFDNQIVLRTTI